MAASCGDNCPLEAALTDPSEATEATCGDSIDNDCDGEVDCADADCYNAPACDLPVIGLFGDTECSVTELFVGPFTSTSFYVRIDAGQVPDLGGAQFQIVGLDPSILLPTFTWEYPGLVSIGNNPFDGTGVAVGFGDCVQGEFCTPLLRVDLFVMAPVQDVVLTVVAATLDGPPCPFVVDCDGNAVCAVGGQLVINRSHP